MFDDLERLGEVGAKQTHDAAYDFLCLADAGETLALQVATYEVEIRGGSL